MLYYFLYGLYNIHIMVFAATSAASSCERRADQSPKLIPKLILPLLVSRIASKVSLVLRLFRNTPTFQGPKKPARNCSMVCVLARVLKTWKERSSDGRACLSRLSKKIRNIKIQNRIWQNSPKAYENNRSWQHRQSPAKNKICHHIILADNYP